MPRNGLGEVLLGLFFIVFYSNIHRITIPFIRTSKILDFFSPLGFFFFRVRRLDIKVSSYFIQTRIHMELCNTVIQCIQSHFQYHVKHTQIVQGKSNFTQNLIHRFDKPPLLNPLPLNPKPQ